jgi:hypothetical protein
MTQEEILEEPRTIRTLLSIDKEEDLEELTSNLSGIQIHILNKFDFVDWSSLSSSEIANKFDC